ncbi:MAG: acetyl-CoA carboxylase carboxyltransferase subunit beta [Alphaproteobacteria bacterium]|nr:acetyl-CoA carboxylase carboxyltransferase subunit beta [Alphaproteobacteria bacterium]
MNWLTNFVRPKLQALVKKNDVPENLWSKCPGCDQMIFHRDLTNNLHVCQYCNYHLRIPTDLRLKILFDDGVYRKVELADIPDDPLKFRDRKRYTDRLKESRAQTKERDAVVVATGRMNDLPVVVALFNFDFMGGSMGVASGEGIVKAARLAVSQQASLIVNPASGGARMQEGILSLMQMPRTIIAVQELKEAGLPYIVLLTDPTTGGVSASFAMLGDIHVAEPGATIGFAGRRVIEQTVRETLPDDFQRSEFLFEHGMVDCIVSRGELRDTLSRIIGLLRMPRPVEEMQDDEPDDTLQIPYSGDAEAADDAAPPGRSLSE